MVPKVRVVMRNTATQDTVNAVQLYYNEQIP